MIKTPSNKIYDMRNSIIKTTCIAIAIICISCKKQKDEFSLNQGSRPSHKLEELALKDGDTNAYHELSIEYMDSPNDTTFYNTALAMANKHDYHSAYLDLYYTLTDYYHRNDYRNLDDLDSQKRKTAIDYLSIGANKGNKDCKKILGQYYLDGKYVTKNEIKGKKLMVEGEAY